MKLLNRRLSIHRILLLVSLLMLLLPLGSLHFLKLYESALVRQTESELIAQAAFMGAIYKQEVTNLLIQKPEWPPYGLPATQSAKMDEYYQPVFPSLDLAKARIYPLRPNGKVVQQGYDRTAREAGRRIMPVLSDAQRTTLSGMKVLDFHGVVVAGQQELGLSFANLPEVRDALQGHNVSLLRRRGVAGPEPPLSSISRGAGINVVVAMPIILKNRVVGVVLLNRTPIDLMKVLYTKRANIAWAAVVIVLMVLAISALTSLTITRPIYALIRQARHITEGRQDASQSIPHPVTQEIALLSESLAEMARTIQHRSAYIRNFATSVSHEFKTPLTAIQGSVELLQEHWDTMEPEQRQRFLANVHADSDRLRRLVNRLLELARAEMMEPTQGATELLSLLDALAARYRERGLLVNFEDLRTQLMDEAPLMVALPAEILETVLVSLWDNSLQHGATTSGLSLVSLGEGMVIAIRDNGAGISSGNRGQVFSPFFTTQRDRGGTGLGLSIVRQLLETHAAQIELTDEVPGATFHLTLPIASLS